jgi:hypothetical protein
MYLLYFLSQLHLLLLFVHYLYTAESSPELCYVVSEKQTLPRSVLAASMQSTPLICLVSTSTTTTTTTTTTTSTTTTTTTTTYSMMCSVADPKTGRTYTRKCKEVVNVTKTLYGGEDIDNEGTAPAGFTDVCPYFDNCVLTKNAVDSNNRGSHLNTECGRNNPYHFIGLLGRVIAIDTAPFIPVLTVTFNDGRTSYEIEQVRPHAVVTLLWL